MCGIVAYNGEKNTVPHLLWGLAQLEYRGYDSAGIVCMVNGEFVSKKQIGQLKNLEDSLKDVELISSVGIGHTRWATHGGISVENAHPHVSNSGRFAIVYNGIVENYLELKKILTENGYTFVGQTDSEILANWIEFTCKNLKTVEEVAIAIEKALNEISGSYAVVIIDKNLPELLWCSRVASPMVLGKFLDGVAIASDSSALGLGEKKIWYVPENKIICVDSRQARKLENNKLESITDWQEFKDGETGATKDGFDFFTMKEIHEQSKVLGELATRYLKNGKIDLGVNSMFKDTGKTGRIIIIACGTSWHAGLAGEYFIEKIAGIPVEVEYASEFRYREVPLFSTDLVIAISQSGETADTLAAVEYAKRSGARVMGLTNVPYSALSRTVEGCIFTYSGKEMGVAATKTFTCQLLVLYLFANMLALNLNKNVNMAELENLKELPAEISKMLSDDSGAQELSRELNAASFVLYLGRLLGVAAAHEGALKLKELSYIPVQAFPAGEMKHGPLALVDEKSVVVCVEIGNEASKLESNMQEIKARGGKVFLIKPESKSEFNRLVLVSVWLQLAAYYSSAFKGLDVDRPRNLAKTVTVE